MCGGEVTARVGRSLAGLARELKAMGFVARQDQDGGTLLAGYGLSVEARNPGRAARVFVHASRARG